MQNKPEFTTDVLLSLMVRIQSIRKAAQEQGFQSGSDPRYSAVGIKAEALLERLRKLVAPVMLAEIAGLEKLTKDLYQMFSESEGSEITHGTNDRGN